MSEKRLDAKNRWRNVVVAFRMSPEEAQELNVKVSLSGLSKQDYIIQCLLKHEIRVVGGMKVAKKVQVHLDTILEELQTLDEADRGIDVGGYENVSDSVKADVFGFDIADVSGSIRLFSDVMKRLEIKLDGDEMYEEFQRIYDESVSRDAGKDKAEDKMWNRGRGR